MNCALFCLAAHSFSWLSPKVALHRKLVHWTQVGRRMCAKSKKKTVKETAPWRLIIYPRKPLGWKCLKGNKQGRLFYQNNLPNMAERVGFEPTCPWRPTVFETFLRNGLSWKMGENSRLFWKWKRLDKAGFLRHFYPRSRMKSSEFEFFAEMAQNGWKKAKWREFGKKGEEKERISALEV